MNSRDLSIDQHLEGVRRFLVETGVLMGPSIVKDAIDSIRRLRRENRDLLAACEAFQRWDENPHATESDAAELRRLMATATRNARESS